MADFGKDSQPARDTNAISRRRNTDAPVQAKSKGENQSPTRAGNKHHRGQGLGTPRQNYNTDLGRGKENGPSSTLPPVIGFDNSDRNPTRKSIGSCTDKVADERRFFGPWKAPDSDQQRRLVERLAPHKPPAPPDPRFDHWVCHFQYYWNIGVDVKSPRSRLSTPRSSDGDNDNAFSRNNTSYPQNGRYVTQYHRLLRRPQTTPGRLGSTDSEGEHNMSTESSGSGSGGSGRQMTSRYASLRQTQSAYPRGYGSAGADYENGRVVSGLDRRYMGLQSVNRDQMEEIVRRLTRMTSAYNAKFAPNPHVWTDTSPGAHMVKRENMLA